MEGRLSPRRIHVLVGRYAVRRRPKPLLRGWLHAVAVLGAVAATIGLVAGSISEPRRLIALLIFGLSMIALYSASTVYHLGTWTGRRLTIMRAIDHASIFLLIAGTYTPICLIVLAGWLASVVLALIWGLTAVGMGCALLALRLPRWAAAAQYIGVGWLALIPLPQMAQVLPTRATLVFAIGGLLYTTGAVIYAVRQPNPWPRVFGFHELFHLLVVGGSAAFLIGIWMWVAPYKPG
jgi:hemolysin III